MYYYIFCEIVWVTSTLSSLFLIGHQVLPNLEELALGKTDFGVLRQQGQLCKLKVLHVIFDESDVFPVGLLQNVHNLEKVVLTECSYKEIFSYTEVEVHAERLAQIKSLKLKRLWNMEHLWKPDSKLDSFIQNLEILDIESCNNIQILVPSSASFKNLAALKICRCAGSINLVKSSTVKSLLHLREMKISSCDKMTVVVANDGDEQVEIVFSKLKWLFLEALPSLTSFCSGDYAFNFPSLEHLIVTKCPKMNIFAAGVIKTPRLREVQNGALNEECWSGDLNTTIQHLHEKMVCTDSISSLTFP